MADNKNMSIVLTNVKLEANRNHIDGAEKKNNSAGKRSFTIIWNMADPSDAAEVNSLIEAGWPVVVEPRYKTGDPDDIVGRLKVNINYKHSTPPVFKQVLRDPVLDKNGKQVILPNGEPAWTNIRTQNLDEELSKEITGYDITDITVYINTGSYLSQFTGEWATSVYLKEFWFVLIESPIAYMSPYMDALKVQWEDGDGVPFDMN